MVANIYATDWLRKKKLKNFFMGGKVIYRAEMK